MSRGFNIVLLVVLCLMLAFVVLLSSPELIAIPCLIVVGFIPFLRDAIDRVSVEWTAVTSAVVCLALFAIGTHALAARLWRSPSRQPWRVRWSTIGVVGLFTAFASGTAMIGVVHQVSWLGRGPIVHTSRPHAVTGVVDKLFSFAAAEHLGAASLRRDERLLQREDEFRIAIVADEHDVVRAVVGMPRDPQAGYRVAAWITKSPHPGLPLERGMLPAEMFADIVHVLERGEDPAALVDNDRALR